MWSLIDKAGRILPLKDNETTTIGRKNTDIILDNDGSISKQHAKIQVSGLNCIIIDTGAKYGTTLITERDPIVITKDGYKVKNLDKIQFGLQHHMYTLSYKVSIKYFVLASGVPVEAKEKLVKILDKISGKLCDQWSEQCTHATCPTVKLTEKITCALAAGIPIVTLEYWPAVLQAQVSQSAPPNPINYLPLLDPGTIAGDKISLLTKRRRDIIFKGLTFIHFTAGQHKLYSTMINLAGGSSTMYDQAKKLFQEFNEHTIIVQPYDHNNQNESPSCSQYTSVYKQLTARKLRPIPEADIPLAILYCSLAQHCNPRYNYKNLLKSCSIKKNVTGSSILTEETQPTAMTRQRSRDIIPESVPVESFVSEPTNVPELSAGKKRTAICMERETHVPVMPTKKLKEDLPQQPSVAKKVETSTKKLSSFFMKTKSPLVNADMCEPTVEVPVKNKIEAPLKIKLEKTANTSKDRSLSSYFTKAQPHVVTSDVPKTLEQKKGTSTTSKMANPYYLTEEAKKKRSLTHSDEEDPPVQSAATMKKAKLNVSSSKSVEKKRSINSDMTNEIIKNAQWIKIEPKDETINGNTSYVVQLRDIKIKCKWERVKIPAQRLSLSDMHEWVLRNF